MRTQALFIGGRSGVGKTTVAFEVHARLSAARVRHCLIEGDNLDQAYPAPWEHGLAERNLAAMWANYRALGYRRMVYTNTASVFEDVLGELVAAMGEQPEVTAVLLTCADAAAAERLAGREIGSALGEHVERGRVMAAKLDAEAPDWVHRVGTDGRGIADIAAEVVDLTRWLP
ncbi:adenylyl-sulfate kinase [Nocardia nepalensis]|uniref:adenylyl-sulfate kinase n=1 Tax=Nocardia nepalensis TaxID=3375448 RepID=UPI003B67AD9C